MMEGLPCPWSRCWPAAIGMLPFQVYECWEPGGRVKPRLRVLPSKTTKSAYAAYADSTAPEEIARGKRFCMPCDGPPAYRRSLERPRVAGPGRRLAFGRFFCASKAPSGDSNAPL